LALRRLRLGEWLAAAGGVLMIVSLLTPWYEGASGYEAMTIIDVLLTLLALLAIALAVLQATRDSPALPVGAGVLTAALGIPGVLLVLFRIVDDPFDGAELAAGAWLGLVVALAIAVGGWRSIDTEYVEGLPPDLEPDLRPTPAP
jgi:predicted MFS family arabinose efflux permease